MPDRHHHRLRVRYAECDAQGVVFNAHYLTYFDVGLTELWRAAFGSYGAMIERGTDVVVVEATVRYRSPARFDDELDLEIAVDRIGRTSIQTAYRIVRDGTLLAEGSVVHVTVEAGTSTKIPVPEWMRAQLGRPPDSDDESPPPRARSDPAHGV